MRYERDLITRLFEHRQIDPATGCWEWTGVRFVSGGYGKIKVGGRQGKWRKVHRVAAALWLEFDLDDERFVCHHCDNPPCFNPQHLFIGDARKNGQDRARKRRGREARQQGENAPLAKLTEQQVREIVRLVEAGMTQVTVAEQFGIKQAQVSRLSTACS